MESQCLVDFTNFIKTTIFKYIFIFNMLQCTYFLHIYILTSHHMKLKMYNFFGIWLLCVLTYHNMQKHPSSQWHGWNSNMGILKNNTMWNNFGPFVMCFHL